MIVRLNMVHPQTSITAKMTEKTSQLRCIETQPNAHIIIQRYAYNLNVHSKLFIKLEFRAVEIDICNMLGSLFLLYTEDPQVN